MKADKTVGVMRAYLDYEYKNNSHCKIQKFYYKQTISSLPCTRCITGANTLKKIQCKAMRWCITGANTRQGALQGQIVFAKYNVRNSI